MKRFITALAFCSVLLIFLSLLLFPPVAAKENTLLALLNLPAPPPPNPLVSGARARDEKFYSKKSVPADDAAIGDLLDYWSNVSGSRQPLRYSPEMSEKTRERIMREIDKNPKLLTGYLNVLKDNERAGEFVKELYDREGSGGTFSRDERKTIKEWLTVNTPFFSSELARRASSVADTGEYVTNQDELLALTRVDFDKAQPIIERLMGESSAKTSRVLALWAFYRHAQDTNSTGDIERYRDELKAVVEDKSALPGMRDLAMDALVAEKDWAGRDEWYYSLLGDETLAELKVNGSPHTGLTTLILVSPEDKYIEKMIELAGSSNVWVRTAAVKNLITRLETGGPELLRALVPWLEDPKWAVDTGSARQTLVNKLAEHKIPESVPGLVAIMNETERRSPSYGANMAANAVASATNTVANAANWAGAPNSNANSRPASGDETISYPYRYFAVLALKKQEDGRAIPALRRILPEGESYERSNVVGALLASGGFSVPEQLAALETAAKGVREDIDAEDAIAEGADANAVYADRYSNLSNTNTAGRTPTAAEINAMVGTQLLQQDQISDDLARGIVDRVEVLDTKDNRMAAAYRRMVLRWQNSVINRLLLRDVERGLADSETVLRLVSQRKALRETMSSDVSALRNGKPMARGISACIFEDAYDFPSMLESGEAEAKIALLACARLIRAPLPVASVAANLTSPNAMLVTAAERYLESEDSVQARNIVLGRHPGEAKILGATSAFFVEGVAPTYGGQLWELYKSVGNDALYNGWSGSGNDDQLAKIEKRLQEEVKKDDTLLGIYAYESSYIRIHKDRVIFSWDEDESRYRERPLTKYEFDEIKGYLESNRVDELAPFLQCGGEYCQARELIMLGRNGGRRVYMNGDPGDFFAGLDKYFADLKKTPASLKYAMSRETPGLEIMLASDELYVETVWKEGADLRVAASLESTRKAVEAAIESVDEEGDDDDYELREAKKAAIRKKREYEGYGWYRLDGGQPVPSTQPPSVEFIPPQDGLAIPAEGQWKARAGGIELRTSEDGLFKLVRGRLTSLRKGNYGRVVMTPNGRWAVASKMTDSGWGVVRVDLTANREYPIEIEGYGEYYPSAYVSTLNKVLVVRDEYYDHEYGGNDDDTVERDPTPEAMTLLDPATGVMQPIAGEFRPLDQQTFRPLQRTAKLNEFWAALPDVDKNETQVGVFEIKTFGFMPVLRVPRIAFNSMDMWVDDSANKVYIVYRGHLLAVPLRK